MGRIKKLQEKLKRTEGFFVSNPVNIFYLTNFDSRDELCRVFVTKNSAELFFDTKGLGKQKGIFPGIKVESIAAPKIILKNIIKRRKIKKIFYEPRKLSVFEFKELKKIKGVSFKESDNLVEELRKIKGPKEITKIKKACRFSDKTFQFINKKIRAGKTEKEIAKLIDEFIRKNGGELAFPTIVASGPNSANIHHKPEERKIKIGESVVLDFGAKASGYSSDITRTIFLKKVPPKFEKIYSTVLEAQKIALEALKKEKNARKVDEIARKFISKNGFKKKFFHGLGHSLGLDVHEFPQLGRKSKETLKKGMVLTVEPGIYLERVGGVRIEDDVLLKDGKIEVLTKSPKELKDVVILK